MNAQGIDDGCVALAEDFMAVELAQIGEDQETSALVLSLAAAIQDAVDRWYEDHGDEVVP